MSEEKTLQGLSEYLRAYINDNGVKGTVAIDAGSLSLLVDSVVDLVEEMTLYNRYIVIDNQFKEIYLNSNVDMQGNHIFNQQGGCNCGN